MADLEALEAQRNYREFLDHALDVRPSERGTPWRNMVSEMAIGFIDFHRQRERLSREVWLYLDQLSLWPVLQSDEFFQTRLGNFLRAYLPHCLEVQELPKELCAQDVLRYWRNSPRDPDLGIWLAQQSESHQLDLPKDLLLNSVGTTDLSKYFCNRPVVNRYLVKGLVTPMIKKELRDPQLDDHIASLANSECWEHLVAPLRNMIERPEDNVTLAENAFRLLHHKGHLSEREADLFLVRYLLSGPIVGPVFNMAWSRVRELGQNYERRQIVFGTISSLDHLPDQLFASANKEMVATVMDHLNLHFPEYLPFYARTCLNFYQGEGVFPRGNPTLYCDQFFAFRPDEQKIIDQSVRLQYSAIKKAR